MLSKGQRNVYLRKSWELLQNVQSFNFVSCFYLQSTQGMKEAGKKSAWSRRVGIGSCWWFTVRSRSYPTLVCASNRNSFPLHNTCDAFPQSQNSNKQRSGSGRSVCAKWRVSEWVSECEVGTSAHTEWIIDLFSLSDSFAGRATSLCRRCTVRKWVNLGASISLISGPACRYLLLRIACGGRNVINHLVYFKVPRLFF